MKRLLTIWMVWLDKYGFWIAGVWSASDAFINPVPPDPALITIGVKHPQKIWKIAHLVTFTSIVGGMIGYAIGLWGMEEIGWPIVHGFHAEKAYETIKTWYENYGFWAVLVAGITPLPYKIFTISAGATGMPFVPFIIASFLGRAVRFYGVALLTKLYGQKAMDLVSQWGRKSLWLLLVLFVILLGIFLYLR